MAKGWALSAGMEGGVPVPSAPHTPGHRVRDRGTVRGLDQVPRTVPRTVGETPLRSHLKSSGGAGVSEVAVGGETGEGASNGRAGAYPSSPASVQVPALPQIQ